MGKRKAIAKTDAGPVRSDPAVRKDDVYEPKTKDRSGHVGYEELFMNDQERADLKKPKVEDVPLSDLSPFKDHPFKVREDEELERLKDSIRESGVLVPALARPKEDGGYELISGHRRMAACRALGLETMPVIIRDLTDEEAVITMVDANLQREHILPSEKAFAYRMKWRL
ncbi:MAG: ParB/RepB/Spo0J family partition protein [Anaerolineaceae bacterium]|nr:ParB/RepB/Spo0J family partition protein [Anaerolineaceae bacterium]